MLVEDYLTHNEAANTRSNYGTIVVGHNHYFALRDNRDKSSDRRHWGAIEREKIKGKPSIIYISFKNEFPLMRFDRIGKKI